MRCCAPVYVTLQMMCGGVLRKGSEPARNVEGNVQMPVDQAEY